jgi:hypothetical protein
LHCCGLNGLKIKHGRKNALLELTNPDYPGHQVALEHQQSATQQGAQYISFGALKILTVLLQKLPFF